MEDVKPDQPTYPPDANQQAASINKQRRQYGIREMEREADSHSEPLLDPTRFDYGEDW
jgi:hypothetical protein